MQETWVQSPSREDALKKEMTSHSSILPWGIPWTEKPVGLQSMGLQRVGHDWARTRQILPMQNLSFLMTELALPLIFILWTILSSYIWELTSRKYISLLKLWAFRILGSSQSTRSLGVAESWRRPALPSFATSGPTVVSLNICLLLSSGTPLCSAPKWSFAGHFAGLTPLDVSSLFLHFEMSLYLSLHVKSYSLFR